MLLAHTGSAAAASPQSDIQQQVMGNGLPNRESRGAPDSANGGSRDAASRLDAQEFARRLLLGWSACSIGDTKSPRQHLNLAVSHDSGKSSAEH